MSRFGVDVKEDAIKNDIFVELAGDIEEVSCNVIDIRQIVAMLLIPHLVKISDGTYVTKSSYLKDAMMEENEVPKEEVEEVDHPHRRHDPNVPSSQDQSTLVDASVIEAIANEIIADTVEGGLYGPNSNPKVTRNFIRKLFEAHGEDFVSDAILDDMVDAIGGKKARFNATSFKKALTSDLKAWRVDWETNLSTSYADVLHLNALNEDIASEENVTKRVDRIPTRMSSSVLGSSVSSQKPEFNDKLKEKARNVFTASAIDNISDSYGENES
jgi:hypothetical protein